MNPIRGEAMKETRYVLMLLEREQPVDETFVTAAAEALREYADVLDLDATFEGPHLDRAGVFVARNGCVLKYAAGDHSPEVGHAAKANPSSSTRALQGSSAKIS